MTSVTRERIESKIVREGYFIIPETTTTVCSLTMENGFVQVGTSACVDPESFNVEMGRKIARDDAFEKLWALEGYLLLEEIFRGGAEPDDEDDGLEEIQIQVVVGETLKRLLDEIMPKGRKETLQ